MPIKQNLLSLLLTDGYFLPSPTPGMMAIFYKVLPTVARRIKLRNFNSLTPLRRSQDSSWASGQEACAGVQGAQRDTEDARDGGQRGLQDKTPAPGPKEKSPPQDRGPPETSPPNGTGLRGRGREGMKKLLCAEDRRNPSPGPAGLPGIAAEISCKSDSTF